MTSFLPLSLYLLFAICNVMHKTLKQRKKNLKVMHLIKLLYLIAFIHNFKNLNILSNDHNVKDQTINNVNAISALLLDTNINLKHSKILQLLLAYVLKPKGLAYTRLFIVCSHINILLISKCAQLYHVQITFVVKDKGSSFPFQHRFSWHDKNYA